MMRFGWMASLGLVAAGFTVLGVASEPQTAARQILAKTGVKGGLVVHVGCSDGRLTAALRAGDGYLVHGLDADAKNVEAARKHIQSQKVYGPVSVAQFCGKRLPYIEDSVNLVVADDLGGVPMSEVMRVLAPNGAAWIGGKITVKPRPAGMDEWTHYLHDPGNNAVAHDELIAPLTRLQWIAGPLYSRHHDHMSGASGMVSAGGRTFYIFEEAPRASILIPPQWHLYARDAFNGTLLWKRPIEKWHEHMYPLKSGPALLPRRLVAVGDQIYVTMSIDGPLSALDAATGKTLRTYDGTAATEEILFADDVLFLVVADSKSLRSDPKKLFASMADIRADATGGLWGEAPRVIKAVEADSGKVLWEKASAIMPMTLAVDSQRAYFHDGGRIVCLDRKTGREAWASGPVANQRALKSSAAPTLVVYDDVVLFSGYSGERRKGEATTMYALSARDGKKLWDADHPPSGHAGSPKDILVLNGVVWCGATAQGSDSGIMTGRDLHTGKVLKEFPPDVKTHWFHQRCYRQKATDKYLLLSRTGIEFVDVANAHWTCHHWVRGACLYGIMPANGLIYNPPHPCACYLDAKLFGFNALAPDTKHWKPRRDVPDSERLERGPAYDRPEPRTPNPEPRTPNPSDWPTYRGDAARSGAASAHVPEKLNLVWQASIGGKLSAVSVADGRLFVSSVNAHTIHALDAATGTPAWAFTAGGRVDSPPTIWQGRVLFGSADGHVYCLRASDGALAWKFRAAPEDRRQVAFEQVESVWPVHGSVLVQNDVVYCVAGRSMFLDGGLRMIRLDPKTGQKISETILDEQDPATKANLQVHVKGLNMPTALPDVLSSDGRYVYMRTLPFDLNGQRKSVDYVDLKDRQGDDLHLFSPTGFLDDTLWHRTYWIYGRAYASGAGGYFQAGRVVPAGRILVFDEKNVYGYGRRWQYYRWTTPLEFHLFATAKQPEQIRMGQEAKPARGKDGKQKFTAAVTPVMRFSHAWSDELSVQATAMALADKTLFVAGPPDVIDEEEAAKSLGKPETKKKLAEQEAALEGKRGSLLVAVAAGDGKKLAAYRLDSAPVFDGMAAAGGRLYLSTLDGKVFCLGPGQGRPLQPAAGEVVKPRSAEADKPLARVPPATTSKAKGGGKAAKKAAPKRELKKHPDFQHLEAATVTSGGLGYKVEVDEGAGFALKKLAEPLAGPVTFTVKILPTTEGRLQTGFLAFGDGAEENQLVKCGVRFRMKKGFILQGPAQKDGGTTQPVEWQAGKPLDVQVTVDLAAQKVKMTLAGQTIEAPLERPLKSITHVGYYVMSAVTEFSPIAIGGVAR